MKAYMNELLTRGESWGDPFDDNLGACWFSLEEGTVWELIRWVRDKGYTSLDEVEKSPKYLRLFKTDAVKLSYEFMKQYLGTAEEWSEYLTTMQHLLFKMKNYKSSFYEYIEDRGIDKEWEDFLDEHVRADAIAWCKEHGIEWTEESPYDFSGFVPVASRFADCKQE